MPRGGKGEPDGFSPYKTADGRDLRLLKSSKSKTGYYNVVEQHPGKFYPKKKLDDEKGSKKMKVFGTGKRTAREAAIFLAEYLDSPHELPEAPQRKPYGWKDPERYAQRKKEQRLQEIFAEANQLLGTDPEEMAAAGRKEADEYLTTVPTVTAVLTVPPVPVPRVPVAMATQFDPAVLARVASIKAAGRTASPASVCNNLPC